ncbi:MAG: TonB-dependent receptor [Alphaproteobacteria bacterium]|nr:TonB-dependent receptor [Alphaproteobacteria bacterium]
MSRFLLSTSALAATLLTSNTAFAETTAEDTAHNLLSEIVVTAQLEDRELQKLKTPALGVGIGGEQIAAINAINAEDVVRYAPALIVRKRYIGDANATLSFRNMHTTQTPRALVSVDGFTISNFLGADFFTAPKWAVLAPDDIARAEIIYGPTSARYSGHSMGGTMLIKTRDITETAAHLSAQAFGQNYKYYKTDEDLFGWSIDAGVDFALSDRGGISVSYRHFENEGQPQEWRTVSASSLYGGQGIVDKELSFLRIGAQDSVVDSIEDQFRFRAQYALGGGWELRGLAALLVNREDTLNPRSFLRDASGAETFIGVSGVNMGLTESTELLAGVGLSGDAAGWKLDLSFSRFDVLDNKERRSDNFDVVTGARPLTGRLATNDAYWNSFEGAAERSFGAHALALGLSYAGYSDANRTLTTSDWRRASVTGLRDASGGKTRLLGVFAEDAVTLTGQLTATLGLRYESWRASDGFLTNGGATVRYASRSHDAWSPKAALSFKPDDLTEIVASAALATRFPTVRELYQAGLIVYGPNVGQLDLNGFNPDLKPEKAVDLQLTASRRIGNVKVTLSGYRQDVRDTIFSQTIAIPDSVTGDLTQSSLMTNIGKVRTWGADLILSAEDVLIDGLSLDANASWIDAEVTRNPLNPALVGNKFPRVPKWRTNASVRYSPSADWTLAANFRHQSTPDRNIENNSTSLCDTFYCVSTFSFVDLKATKRFGSFQLSAGVDNLLNEKAFVYHPYPGRTFVFGLKWDGRL